MYNTVNKDDVYYVYDRTKNKVTKIGNYEDLIISIVRTLGKSSFNSLWYEHKPWTANEFDRVVLGVGWTDKGAFGLQNLTGSDKSRKYIDALTYEFDLKPFTYFTGTGRVFDIRNIAEDVKKVLLSNQKIRYKTSYIRRGWQYRHATSHTTYEGSRRLHKSEFLNQICCEELGVKYRKKARPYYDAHCCDYNANRRSTGWKSKRYEKQWEHNLINKKKEPKHSGSGRTYWKNYEYDSELDILLCS